MNNLVGFGQKVFEKQKYGDDYWSYYNFDFTLCWL